jgi:hypothetical protein
MRPPLPPGPRRPALAQLLPYLSDPYRHFVALHARHGDVFTLRLPGVGQQVVVASAEGIRQLAAGSYETLEREASALRFVLGGHASTRSSAPEKTSERARTSFRSWCARAMSTGRR